MCKYYTENGKPPCCTHDCNGCVWHSEDAIGELQEAIDQIHLVEEVLGVEQK